MNITSRAADDAAENSIMQTISIAVSAILIAAGLITAPSLINNARDTNAQNDLASLAYAQEYLLSDAGQYSETLSSLKRISGSELAGGVRATYSTSNVRITQTGTDAEPHYTALVLSGSGSVFKRTDASTKIERVSQLTGTTAERATAFKRVVIDGNYAAEGFIKTYNGSSQMSADQVASDGTGWRSFTMGGGGEGDPLRWNLNDSGIPSQNRITLKVTLRNPNTVPVTAQVDVADRDKKVATLQPGETVTLSSTYTPLKDGVYQFGDISLIGADTFGKVLQYRGATITVGAA